MRLCFICVMCVILDLYLESSSNRLLRIENELKQLRSDIAKQSAPTNAASAVQSASVSMTEEELKSIENAYEINMKNGKMILTADVEEWTDEKGKFKIDDYAKPRNFSYGVLIQDEYGNPKNHPDEDLYDSRHNIWFHRAILRKQKYGKPIPFQEMEDKNKGLQIQTITNLTDSSTADMGICPTPL